MLTYYLGADEKCTIPALMFPMAGNTVGGANAYRCVNRTLMLVSLVTLVLLLHLASAIEFGLLGLLSHNVDCWSAGASLGGLVVRGNGSHRDPHGVSHYVRNGADGVISV